MMRFLMRNRLAVLALSPLAVLGMTGTAHAEVPAAVLTAITEAGTDAATIGSAVLVVLIGIWAFKLLRRAK